MELQLSPCSSDAMNEIKFNSPANAFFDETGRYRYLLTRVWDRHKPIAMCVGLNPSKADSDKNDPTINSLIRLLDFNGFGALAMTNLFGLISPDPKALIAPGVDPIGKNDRWLLGTALLVDACILCYGAFEVAKDRAYEVRGRLINQEGIIFNDFHCFGKNANGSPKHPLYLKGDTKIERWGIAKYY